MTEQPQATLTRDEGQLVSEAKAGNYAAFEELVNRYERKILLALIMIEKTKLLSLIVL